MAEPQEYFELPRLDWYDDKGRIYKDRLITNFNAIQQKLLKITHLDPWVETTPDIDDFDYPDTTLKSDNNKIVNLKSFLEIMNIIGYPIECVFTNKTCTKLSYWDSSMNYRTISNFTVDCNPQDKFIVLDYSNNTLKANSSPLLNGNQTMVGIYCDSRIRTVNDNIPVGINVLYYLPNMSHDTYPYTSSRSTNESLREITANGRTIGGFGTNTNTRGSNNVIFHDLGRSST